MSILFKSLFVAIGIFISSFSASLAALSFNPNSPLTFGQYSTATCSVGDNFATYVPAGTPGFTAQACGNSFTSNDDIPGNYVVVECTMASSTNACSWGTVADAYSDPGFNSSSSFTFYSAGGEGVFANLAPPNMDIVCSYEYIAGVLATSTCSDPWNYYKGFLSDFILIIAVAFLTVVAGVKVVKSWINS